MRIQKALAEVRDRLARAREDLRILEEQILFQMDVVEDAKTRSIVSETPLAARDHEDARRDLDRMQKERRRMHKEIAELGVEQDRLLDLMLG